LGVAGELQGLGLARRLERVLTALPHAVFDKVEKKVFRVAFLTVLLIAAIQQFVGWAHVTVVVREAVATVQDRLLPWIGADSEDRLGGVAGRRVATLLLGDEIFADRDGFDHRVPPPPDRLTRLLDTALKRLGQRQDRKPHLMVLDFDLAPRVGDSDSERKVLDDWLADHAASLVLVEPAWTVLHPANLERQLAWARRMCSYEENADEKKGRGAVFAQTGVPSRFGFVIDTMSLDGARGSTWDVGRAVADQIGSHAQHRNPICDLLRGQRAADTPGAAPLLMALKLQLAGDLHRTGALTVKPQPADPHFGHGALELRTDAIRSSRACSPRTLDEVASLPCLADAEVVVVGGAWRHGFSDKHDTFVGEVDGATVHAAWIRSWLHPLVHLNKLLDILLDVIIIESLLHPILEFAFAGMRREADWLSARMNGDVVFQGLGRSVAIAVMLAAVALIAAALTSFALILFDGLLRWAFDRALSLDKTIPALLIWSAVTLGGLVRERESAHGSAAEHAGDEAAHARSAWKWLAVLCVLGGVAVIGAWKLAAVDPTAARLAVAAAIAAVPLAYVARRAWDSGLEARPSLCARGLDLAGRWWRLVGSLGASLRGAPALGVLRRAREVVGALLWLAVWVYALALFLQNTLWGFFLAMLGGG
jgi:hypothetical protein